MVHKKNKKKSFKTLVRENIYLYEFSDNIHRKQNFIYLLV